MSENGFDPNQLRAKDGKWTDGPQSPLEKAKEHADKEGNNKNALSENLKSNPAALAEIAKHLPEGEGLDKFVMVIHKTKTFEEAFDLTRTIQNVPKEVADEFTKLYNPEETRSMRAAFKLFYDDNKMNFKPILSAYHKAKTGGGNPKLLSAVEKLLKK